jgi:hypothetical protein
MLPLKLRPYFAQGAIEPEQATVADGFARVLARLNLDYDLCPDVRAAAEDVLRALSAREKKWAPRQTEKSARRLRWKRGLTRIKSGGGTRI